MNIFTIHIETEQKDLVHSKWLDDTGEIIQKELDLSITKERIPGPENSMDGGITVAISIGALVINTFALILTIIDNRRKVINNASITIEGPGYSYTLNNLTKTELKKIFSKINKNNSRNIKVRIHS